MLVSKIIAKIVLEIYLRRIQQEGIAHIYMYMCGIRVIFSTL